MSGTLDLFPNTLTPGESVSVTFMSPSYAPEDGWAIAYRFAATDPITVDGVDDSEGGFTVALTAAQTLTMTAGALVFDAIATKGPVSTAVDRGQITVMPSPITVSRWQAVLTAVEESIAGFAGNSNRSMTVDGMSVTYRSMDELLNLRAFCIKQIARDKGSRLPHVIRSVFT